VPPTIPDPAAVAGVAPKLILNPAYAAPDNLAIALLVLVAILLVAKFGKGFLANIAVLLGIVAGCVAAGVLGKMSFAKVAEAKWFSVVMPLQFGTPTFDFFAVLTMTLVMIVVMIESLGMFLALSAITGKRLTQAELSAGLRADGIGTLIGGLFNTFPYTSFSQNVGLVGVTGVRSRWVCVAGGVILMVMGLIPALGALVEAVPQFVLGGAGIVMFGMVAATGVRILADVDYAGNRHNLFIVAIAIGFGMIPLVAPGFFQHFPKALSPLVHSGILLAALVAVALNLYFNGIKSAVAAQRDAAASASHAEAG
jgi:NCS2 family nucleobase:cation symporter-2